eukprot:934688-Rhodomonas_salina.1
MRQLDYGLGGVVLTRVVATKLIRIDASILEQGVERRLVDAAGRVLSDQWLGAAEEEVDLGNNTETGMLRSLGISSRMWMVWSATKAVLKGVEPMGVQRML